LIARRKDCKSEGCGEGGFAVDFRMDCQL
jgi:hypothetical protein